MTTAAHDAGMQHVRAALTYAHHSELMQYATQYRLFDDMFRDSFDDFLALLQPHFSSPAHVQLFARKLRELLGMQPGPSGTTQHVSTAILPAATAVPTTAP